MGWTRGGYCARNLTPARCVGCIRAVDRAMRKSHSLSGWGVLTVNPNGRPGDESQPAARWANDAQRNNLEIGAYTLSSPVVGRFSDYSPMLQLGLVGVTAFGGRLLDNRAKGRGSDSTCLRYPDNPGS